jgi:hypothetical protein
MNIDESWQHDPASMAAYHPIEHNTHCSDVVEFNRIVAGRGSAGRTQMI